ncbi:MAG: insulinase family protein [Ardenticatenia bacterium]|nr:MAG: insulinase family protein [Ardenticatenia bacterium]
MGHLLETIESGLPNGLKVLVRPVHSAPVATCWVWYRVGSRNEIPGRTGISHWVEHMMFKGTPTFPKGSIMRLINKNGGHLNGFTSEDYTAYFETLPSDRIDLALRIESDRMANSVFDPAEVEAERTVIISERQGDENFPEFLLNEEVTALAFRAHPYRHQVIGWKEDLWRITRDELWTHYRTYYGPHNAVLVVVGDVAPSALLKRVEELFGGIPAGESPPPVIAREPPQTSERRVVLRRPGTAQYFLAAFHVPEARHPDSFPLMVLEAVLSGASPMSITGGATPTHRSARLYRALVETELAVRAGCNYSFNIDPGLFLFSATVRDGRSLEEVETAIWEQIKRLQDEPVSADELQKTQKQARAQFAYALESVSNQGFWLGLMEMVDTHRSFDTLLDQLAAVTAADVQRVAQTYLTETNRTVGWFVPTEHQEVQA